MPYSGGRSRGLTLAQPLLLAAVEGLWVRGGLSLFGPTMRRGMRAVDVKRLSDPFEEGADRANEAAAMLGVAVPRWNELRDSILEDLRVTSPYGISWWAPHPGASRRILISDQLYACASSLGDNLLEAALHQLEYLDYAERHSDRFADCLSFVYGEPAIKAPPPRDPLEELGLQMVRMHYAGVVRALSSALDCLAAVIVGVVALPTSILKADLGKVRELLRRTNPTEQNAGQKRQTQFADRLETLIGEAGPKGWLDWTLHFRNMLVHRGRRIEIGQFVPRTPVLLGPDGRPIPRVRVVTHLPRDPGRSDVEVFLDPDQPGSPVLTEDAEQTLTGLLSSTVELAERTAVELLDLWKWRRDNPSELSQPTAEWPKGPSSETTGFPGYAPGSYNYAPSMMTSHPVVLRRIRAAALDDGARGQWSTFD